MKIHFPAGMRFKAWLMLLCLASILVVSSTRPGVSRADNPIVQTNYTADPAPMVYNGTLYLYTSHDEDVTVNNFFTMKDWRVYSTKDMVNWTDHGAQLSLSSFSWAASDAWAGQVVHRNGKFYWYVPVTKRTGGNAIGVAVSNSPTGPFTDALGVPLIANSQIDPTVFIDDDGQAYLYWGNPGLYYVRLNQDMISYSGGIVQVPLTTAGFGTRTGSTSRPTLFEEAPWLSKRNGIYYMSFAAACCSEYIAYSTGPSATGPWTYRGVIMPTQGTSFTNHQGIIDFNGNSYFFYHNGALPGGGGYKRSIAVEKFNYNADGTIPTINMTTAGAPQIGTLNPYVTTQAETIAWSSGVETEFSSEGGMNVGFIENGDYIKVKGVNFGSGAASFEARVASATSGGTIELRLGSPTGTLVGTCSVPGTGGWQTWVTRSCGVSGASGTHDLYLRFTGGSGSLFNFNWWKFNPLSPMGTATPTATSGTLPTPTRTATQGGVSPTATRTATPGTGTSYYRLVARHSGKVADVQAPNTSDGAHIGQWSWTGNAWQQWSFQPTDSGYYRIVSRHSGKCLDVSGGPGATGDGVQVIQWACGGGTNQQWRMQDLGNGYVQLIARHSNKCLDVNGASTADGAKLIQWTCGGGTNQQWQRQL